MLRSVSTPVRATAFALLAGLFTLSTTTPSEAQERPFSWTGFYVGIQGGAALGTVDSTNVAAAPCPNTPNFCTTPTQDPSGFFAGGLVGYNWQMGSIVVGLEADFALANISDEVPDNDFIRQYTKIDMFGTARVRAGYAMGNVMPFITGGLAFARAESGEICPDGATGGWCLPTRHGAYDLSETRWIGGWTIGGGIEAAFNRNWTLRAEYLYVDFGKERHVLDPLGVDPNPNPVRPSASDRNADWTMHVLRATLNYKF